jgi:hypothetical protein
LFHRPAYEGGIDLHMREEDEDEEEERWRNTSHFGYNSK